MEPRLPEGLVRVDVADPGHEPLIEEQRLEAAFSRPDPPPEDAGRERFLEWLRPEALEALLPAELAGEVAAGSGIPPRDADPPELPDVPEPQLPTVVELEDQPDVRIHRHRRIHDEELAGHLEVD